MRIIENITVETPGIDVSEGEIDRLFDQSILNKSNFLKEANEDFCRIIYHNHDGYIYEICMDEKDFFAVAEKWKIII